MKEPEESRLKEGELALFVASLNLMQRRRWEAIFDDFQRQLKSLSDSANSRDRLFQNIQAAIGEVKPEEVKELIRNGIVKGNAQILRVLAQLGGADLTEKNAVQPGEGAKVIIFKPYSKRSLSRGTRSLPLPASDPPVKRKMGRPRKVPLDQLP